MYTGRFSTHRPQSKSNGGFDGAVFDPNAGLRTAASGSIAAPIIPSEVSAPQQSTLLSRLYLLRPESEGLKARLRAAINELAEPWREAEEVEVLILQEQRQALESKYRKIREEGRAKDKVHKQLARELQAAEEAVMNSGLRKESLVNEVQNLSLLEQRGQHVGRWADEKELAEWERRVEEAKSRVTAANQLFAEAVQTRNLVVGKFQQAEAELQKIGMEEIRLRKQLAGEDYVDPELGLQVPA